MRRCEKHSLGYHTGYISTTSYAAVLHHTAVCSAIQSCYLYQLIQAVFQTSCQLFYCSSIGPKQQPFCSHSRLVSESVSDRYKDNIWHVLIDRRIEWWRFVQWGSDNNDTPAFFLESHSTLTFDPINFYFRSLELTCGFNPISSCDLPLCSRNVFFGLFNSRTHLHVCIRSTAARARITSTLERSFWHFPNNARIMAL